MDAKPKKELPSWKGKTIAKPEDAQDLESHAALLEFKHKMGREDAEHSAHHEYAKKKHLEGAAHHLTGLKAAQATGSHSEAQKHSLIYKLHLEALSMDPMGPVPDEVKALVKDSDKFYKFKPHKNDALLFKNDKP
jgi:hypothetical protein